MYDLGDKVISYKFGQRIIRSLVLSLSLLHDSKMRNMHIYQKKKVRCNEFLVSVLNKKMNNLTK